MKTQKPRNPIVAYLVSHPNRGMKKHKDKKQAARMPTTKEIKEMLTSDATA